MGGESSPAPSAHRPPPRVATTLRVTTRAIQLVLFGLLAFTLVSGSVGYAVNTGVMLGIALLPDAARLLDGRRPNPALAALVALAPFLHAVGSLGPYRTVPIFDQIAHGVSSALVAGFGYVLVQVVDTHVEGVEIPPRLRFAFVLIFAVSFGVLWEILEFASGLVATAVGGEPLLAQYGLDDIVLDLVFDAVGALVVAVWGAGYFDGLRGRIARRLDASE